MSHPAGKYVTALALLFCGTASASDYFVRFDAESGQRGEMTVRFGAHVLGPRPVSRTSPSSFGPVHTPLPDRAIVELRVGQAETTETVNLRSGIPSSFDAIVFRIATDGSLKVVFTQRVDGWRNVEIPLNESAEAARLRELNELLHIAAGRGQLSEVKAAVAKGADVNYLFDTIYPSPVRFAANGKHNEVVDFLLANGARVRKRDLVVPYLKERAEALGLDVR